MEQTMPPHTFSSSARLLYAFTALVAVSIIAPLRGAQPARELLALRRAVGRRVDIVVGGPSAALVDDVLGEARATRLNTLREWREFLAERHRRSVSRTAR